MRTRLKGFSIIPVAVLALAMMLPAKAGRPVSGFEQKTRRALLCAPSFHQH